MLQVKTAEILGKVSGGGGGVGDPFDREPAKVLRDVVHEVVSIEAARELYGVVIDQATLTVDEQATRALRKSRRTMAKGAMAPAADVSGVE